jgi:mono/diheme cytochrome c family protein
MMRTLKRVDVVSTRSGTLGKVLTRAHALLLLTVLALLSSARADDAPWPPVSLADPQHFVPRDGATLYRIVCQGCHMADAKGTPGTGFYPALAQNPRLQSAGYPITLVLNGLRAMPRFGSQLDDEQVAAVVDFVRANFGNHYTDKTPASLVKTLRR